MQNTAAEFGAEADCQRRGRGLIVQIEPFYLVVEFPDGVRANLLRSRWPHDAREPALGLTLQCRYRPEDHEVCEVLHVGLRSLRQAGLAHQTVQEGATPAESANGAYVNSPGLHLPPAAEWFAQQGQTGRDQALMQLLYERTKAGQLEWYAEVGSRSPHYVELKPPLEPLVQQVFQGSAAHLRDLKLYQHQVRTIESLRAGRDLVLLSRPAGGKTLGYRLALFERLLQPGPLPRVLLIFPHNAPLITQMEQIKQLCEVFRQHGRKPRAELLLEGMGRQRREALAAHPPHLLGVTPAILHLLLERGSNEWRTFFAQLHFIVLEDVHAYTCPSGAHLAGLLRRLALLHRRLGVQAQLIMAAAPLANGLEVAAQLSGRPASKLTLIDAQNDGAPIGHTHWAMLSPYGEPPGHTPPHLVTAAQTMVDLLCATTAQGTPRPVTTLLSARSTQAARTIFALVKQGLEHRRPDLLPKVRKFDGAELRPDERRQIATGLQRGLYLGLIATNIFEAGLEPGPLQACINAGLPATLLPLHWLVARLGHERERLMLVVPDPGASTDAFYREHPAALLEQQPVSLPLACANPAFVRRHLNAAAMELGSLALNETLVFGADVDDLISRGVETRVLIERRGRLFGTRPEPGSLNDPYALQQLRASLDEPYTVCLESDPRGQVALLDQWRAYHEGHPQAILSGPDGWHYRVSAFDSTARVISVQRLAETSLERTAVAASTQVELPGRPQMVRQLANGASLSLGRVNVKRRLTGYLHYHLLPVRRCPTCQASYGEEVANCPICHQSTRLAYEHAAVERRTFAPPWHEQALRLELETQAAWLSVPHEFTWLLGEALRLAGAHATTDKPGSERQNGQTDLLALALPMLANTLLRRYPGVALAEPDDLGSLATVEHSGIGGPAIFWFDTCAGGKGDAEQVFTHFERLLEASQAMVRGCACTALNGCPGCIRLSGDNPLNPALSKPTVSLLIDLLLGRPPVLPTGQRR